MSDGACSVTKDGYQCRKYANHNKYEAKFAQYESDDGSYRGSASTVFRLNAARARHRDKLPGGCGYLRIRFMHQLE
jgi:hypothetical protein